MVPSSAPFPYHRQRVSSIFSNPPPGVYATFKMSIMIETETPGATILVTTDGSAPVQGQANCIVFNPSKRFETEGAGVHNLTIVALKENCIPTEPCTVTYELVGPHVERRNIVDHIVLFFVRCFTDLQRLSNYLVPIEKQ